MEFPKLQVLAPANQHLVQLARNISALTPHQFLVQEHERATTMQIRLAQLYSDERCPRTNDREDHTLCNHPNQEFVVVASAQLPQQALGFRQQMMQFHSFCDVPTY